MIASETLVNFYQSTRRYNPEDSHLRTHRLENLKSYQWIERFVTKVFISFPNTTQVIRQAVDSRSVLQ
jgi:hypothetical protein